MIDYTSWLTTYVLYRGHITKSLDGDGYQDDTLIITNFDDSNNMYHH